MKLFSCKVWQLSIAFTFSFLVATSIVQAQDATYNNIRINGEYSQSSSANFEVDAPFISGGRFIVNTIGNVGININNPSDRLHVNGRGRFVSGLKIDGTSTLEFGYGVAGKEANAGKIGYQTFTSGALDIVGAGPSANRKIKLWAEGGLEINGNVGIGTTSPSYKLQVVGEAGNSMNITTNGRIWSGQNSTSGGIWVNSINGNPTQFFGTLDNTTNMGIFNNGWRLAVSNTGNVGIGTNTPAAKLDVNGDILANRMYIGNISSANVRDDLEDATGISYYLWVEKGVAAEDFAMAAKADWDDYVFNKDYKLPSLKKVAAFIEQHKHLPNFPSEKEVKEKGYTVHKMNRNFLKTMEEMTLYAIAQEEKLEQQQTQIDAQQKEIEALKAQMATVLELLNKK